MGWEKRRPRPLSSSKTSSSLRCQFLHQQVELRRREMSSRSTDKEDRRGRPPYFGQIGADPFLLRSRFDVVLCEMFSRFPLCSLARVSPRECFRALCVARSLGRFFVVQTLSNNYIQRTPPRSLLPLLQSLPLRPHIFSIFRRNLSKTYHTWPEEAMFCSLLSILNQVTGSSSTACTDRSDRIRDGFPAAHASRHHHQLISCLFYSARSLPDQQSSRSPPTTTK